MAVKVLEDNTSTEASYYRIYCKDASVGVLGLNCGTEYEYDHLRNCYIGCRLIGDESEVEALADTIASRTALLLASAHVDERVHRGTAREVFIEVTSDLDTAEYDELRELE